MTSSSLYKPKKNQATGHNQEGEISKRLTGNRATEREAQKHTLSHTLAIVKREREIKRSMRPRYRRKWVWKRKTRIREPTLSVPSKTSPEAQNKKTEPDAPGTAQNDSESEKYENGTWRPRYRRKRVNKFIYNNKNIKSFYKNLFNWSYND
jgi:hypothetical protein